MAEGQGDPLLVEAEQLRRKSEKPPKVPRWAPTNPIRLQIDVEDAIATRVRVMAVVNKTTVAHIVNRLLSDALAARNGQETLAGLIQERAQHGQNGVGAVEKE